MHIKKSVDLRDNKINMVYQVSVMRVLTQKATNISSHF